MMDSVSTMTCPTTSGLHPAEWNEKAKGRLPILIKTISEMTCFVKSLPKEHILGFVPTMGYLHQGHLSLVKRSTNECESTIVSIFVNPKQFGENEDLDKYPRDLANDLSLLSSYKVDAVFCPEYEEMYQKDFKTYIEVEDLSKRYCGKSRPGHFRGVTTVVNKLLNIVKADFVYMGEKDFQQIFILEKMIDDLNLSAKIVRCPIVREADGLAMSSRNVYLSQGDIRDERKKALCLHKSLLLARDLFEKGERDIEVARAKMENLIRENEGEIDYIAFINEHTFEEVGFLDEDTRVLLAVKIGKTRLIDNMAFRQNNAAMISNRHENKK